MAAEPRDPDMDLIAGSPGAVRRDGAGHRKATRAGRPTVIDRDSAAAPRRVDRVGIALRLHLDLPAADMRSGARRFRPLDLDRKACAFIKLRRSAKREPGIGGRVVDKAQ